MTVGLIFGPSSSANGFFPMPVGGGGAVTLIDWPTTSSPLLCGTDTGGAYKWNTSTLRWDQLVTTVRMPAAYVGLTAGNDFNQLGGVYGIVSAPNTPARIYMLYTPIIGGAPTPSLFISNDTGASFTVQAGWTPLPGDASSHGPSGYVFEGNKIAVDPNNKDVLYIATEGSLLFSNDGGATWGAPSGITASGSKPGGISFGPAVSTTTVSGQTRTTTIWVNSPGNGVYKSSNGGVSFSLITSSTTGIGYINPSQVTGSDVCFCCDSLAVGSGWTNVYRIKGTTWENITNAPVSGSNCLNPIPSPFNVDILYLVSQVGSIYWSSNANSAAAGSVSYTGTQSACTNISATDVPWLAMGGTIPYLGVAACVFDPNSVATPKLMVTGGTGVWSTVTGPGSNITPAYVSQTLGIDELICNWIIAPPGGKPISIHWDRPIFRHANIDAAPTTYQPNYPNLSVTAGWSADWASADPTFLVALIIGKGSEANESTAYSTDGGVTWNRYFTTSGKHIPNLAVEGGCIAASTALNSMLAYSNQNDVYYTLDNGATVWPKVAAATFGHGVRNSGDLTITVTAATTSGGVVTCTCASTAAIANGYDQIRGSATNTLPGITGSFSSNPAITVINGTTFSLSGSFTGTLTSNGTLTYIPYTGWGESAANTREGICADRVAANTFYLYNSAPTTFGGGIYRTTDGGVTMTQRISATLGTTANEKLRSVPRLSGVVDTTGHLFFYEGFKHGNGGSLRYSTNGATSIPAILNVTEPYAVGFGAPLQGNDYPTVFMIGFVGTQFGVWRCTASSTDWAAAASVAVPWTQLTGTGALQYPFNSTDLCHIIEGDPDVYGRFYIGTHNSVFYGRFS